MYYMGVWYNVLPLPTKPYLAPHSWLVLRGKIRLTPVCLIRRVMLNPSAPMSQDTINISMNNETK